MRYPTALILGAVLLAGGPALAADTTTQTSANTAGVEAGVLTCKSVQGTRLNLLIHSTVDVRCIFKNSQGKKERYKGETGIGLGVDLNWDRDEKIAFTVLSGGTDIRPGEYSLAGKYAGGKASVTAGVGIGAAALVGGSDDNVALQPLAIEESTGLGIAAGLTYLSLEPDPAAE